MKIVHLIDYFQPTVGYQETFLAKEHQKLGHEVWVVTSDRYFPFPEYNQTYFKVLGKRLIGKGSGKEEGIQTIRLKSLEIPFTNLIWLFDLKRILKAINPDVVFCHGVYSLTSWQTASLKNKFSFHLIYDNHASFFNTNFKNSIPKLLYHFIFSVLAIPHIKKEPDAIFSIGEEEQRFICTDLHISKRQIPIIRLGVDTDLFSYSGANRRKKRQELHIRDNETAIIYAGKIAPNKDVHILFKAMEKITDKQIKLIIIGGGGESYINQLQLTGLPNVVWTPFVANRHLPAFFSAADIGIWPGDPSNAMLEAMACRVPLIIPKWSETDYLTDSSGVVTFTRGNSLELAKAIVTLINNIKFRLKLAENAGKYVKRELSWSKIAINTLNLIKN